MSDAAWIIEQLARNQFPQHAEWVGELIGPLLDHNIALTRGPQVSDLGNNPAAEVPWCPVNKVLPLFEDHLSFGQLRLGEYDFICDDLVDHLRNGHVTANDALVAEVTLFLNETLQGHRRALQQLTGDAGMLYVLAQDQESRKVLATLQTKMRLSRGLFKLFLVTMLSRMGGNPSFDCTLAIERWKRGNLLVAVNQATNEAVYLCSGPPTPSQPA